MQSSPLRNDSPIVGGSGQEKVLHKVNHQPPGNPLKVVSQDPNKLSSADSLMDLYVKRPLQKKQYSEVASRVMKLNSGNNFGTSQPISNHNDSISGEVVNGKNQDGSIYVSKRVVGLTGRPTIQKGPKIM